MEDAFVTRAESPTAKELVAPSAMLARVPKAILFGVFCVTFALKPTAIEFKELSPILAPLPRATELPASFPILTFAPKPVAYMDP